MRRATKMRSAFCWPSKILLTHFLDKVKISGHAERLIDSIRREYLDRVVIFGEGHLRQVFKAYAADYNNVRTHLCLGEDAPLIRPVQWSGIIATRPILGGLHHQLADLVLGRDRSAAAHHDHRQRPLGLHRV